VSQFFKILGFLSTRDHISDMYSTATSISLLFVICCCQDGDLRGVLRRFAYLLFSMGGFKFIFIPSSKIKLLLKSYSIQLSMLAYKFFFVTE